MTWKNHSHLRIMTHCQNFAFSPHTPLVLVLDGKVRSLRDVADSILHYRSYKIGSETVNWRFSCHWKTMKRGRLNFHVGGWSRLLKRRENCGRTPRAPLVLFWVVEVDGRLWQADARRKKQGLRFLKSEDIGLGGPTMCSLRQRGREMVMEKKLWRNSQWNCNQKNELQPENLGWKRRE